MFKSSGPKGLNINKLWSLQIKKTFPFFSWDCSYQATHLERVSNKKNCRKVNIKKYSSRKVTVEALNRDRQRRALKQKETKRGLPSVDSCLDSLRESFNVRVSVSLLFNFLC
jgi:hypothetical protein